MARPYTSQILHMKSLAKEDGIPEQAFNEQYMLHYSQLYQYRHTDTCAIETFDILYYLVEKDTWSYFWPDKTFPGRDPRNTYESQLEAMKKKARNETMDEKGFNDMWMQCFEKAVKDQREVRDMENREGGSEKIEGGGVGMEIVQYEAERGFWERRWGSSQGEFIGVDPRGGGGK